MTSCRRCLANSLGSYETTLLKVVTGYAEFVNGGKKISPSLVDRIQDRNGKTIWRHDARKCEGCNDPSWRNQEEPLLADTREQIIDSRTAYQIVSMLQGVVQRGTAAYSIGAQIPSLWPARPAHRPMPGIPGSWASRPIWWPACLWASTIPAHSDRTSRALPWRRLSSVIS